MTPTPNPSTETTKALVPAVLVAAGRSRRLGGSVPKVWLELAGESVLLHSLRALRGASSVGPIVVVAPEEDHPAIADLVQAQDLGPVTCTGGGEARTDSVRQGLLSLDTNCGLVLVHDAARPLVLSSDINELVQVARTSGAALLASPVHDSLHQAQDDQAIKTVPREDLWAAETPQIMDRDLLLEISAEARKQGLSPTDEATLYETFVGPISLVRSSAPNPKLTWAPDVAFFEFILHGRHNPRSSPS